MSLLVVGSIAFDDVETPAEKVTDSLGGSALYFSAAASLFVPVKIVAVVGDDFNFSEIEFVSKRPVDLEGVKSESGKTFRWGGKYHQNMNLRDTLYTHLNVFESFNPVIPLSYRNSDFIFLANIDPELQLNVLNSVESPKLTVLDTMNFWISGKRRVLEKVIRRVDAIILNDEEIWELTGIQNIRKAAKSLIEKGLKVVVIKKGEHGAVLVSRDDYFIAPAFPVENVMDPTGAGDSFAGGFLGYLASCGKLTKENWRKAIIYGSTVASFNVEAFSFERLQQLNLPDVERRVEAFREMMCF